MPRGFLFAKDHHRLGDEYEGDTVLKTQEVKRRGTAPKCCCSCLGEPLRPHVIIEPPKAFIEYHPEAVGRGTYLDPYGERGVYMEFSWG